LTRTSTPLDADALDRRVDDLSESAFAFLERLVAAPSVVGREAAAQDIVADELARLGFAVERLPIDETIADDPAAGVPQIAYDGRFDVIGRRGIGHTRLLINGHVDVVPASEPDLWSTAPFEPARRDGWLIGRGAGDMKGGFAMATLAFEALADVAPWTQTTDVSFVSVIEEECTGNGTLSAALAGVLGDEVVLTEPTGLDLLIAGVGIAWFDVTIPGTAGHAESADRSFNPVDGAIELVAELRELEREMNAHVEPAMDGIAHPYNVNVGTVEAGDWPSSVPALARLGIRVGHPTSWNASEIERRVRGAVNDVVRRVPALRDRPPEVRPSGFRAEGYAIDPAHPLVRDLSISHAHAHGSHPVAIAMGSTTDARIYVNRFGIPAICYGPRSRNIHGVDEAVELASIQAGAKTLARFIASRLAPGER
jgi:acetylornithine deacetylase